MPQHAVQFEPTTTVFPAGNDVHVTSIVPFGVEAQLSVLETWRAPNTTVVTINHEREVTTLAEQLPDWVTVVPVRFKRHYGKDFLPLDCVFSAISALGLGGETLISFANSDIALADPALIERLRASSADLSFLSRVDTDASGAAVATYDKGYDVFAFRAASAERIDLAGYFMGIPWWDYVLPLRFVQEGLTVERLDGPFVTHRIHDQNWPLALFYDIGGRLIRKLLGDEQAGQIPEPAVLEFAKQVNAYLNGPNFSSGAQSGDGPDAVSIFDDIKAMASRHVVAEPASDDAVSMEEALGDFLQRDFGYIPKRYVAEADDDKTTWSAVFGLHRREGPYPRKRIPTRICWSNAKRFGLLVKAPGPIGSLEVDIFNPQARQKLVAYVEEREIGTYVLRQKKRNTTQTITLEFSEPVKSPFLLEFEAEHAPEYVEAAERVLGVFVGEVRGIPSAG